MITVPIAILIAMSGALGGFAVTWGMYQGEVKRLRIEHDRLTEHVLAEVRRVDTKLDNEFGKLDERLNVIIRLEVMQSQIERSLEALHRRQDEFDKYTRRPYTPPPLTKPKGP